MNLVNPYRFGSGGGGTPYVPQSPPITINLSEDSYTPLPITINLSEGA